MVNRHRAFWSAMGSPLSDSGINRNIENRKLWHSEVVKMWGDNNLSWEQTQSEKWIRKAFDLKDKYSYFLGTPEGLSDLYFSRARQNK